MAVVQTPAAFRQQRKGLREVLLGKKAKPVEPPKPSNIRTIEFGRDVGTHTPLRRE